jgi:hypothetical protein
VPLYNYVPPETLQSSPTCPTAIRLQLIFSLAPSSFLGFWEQLSLAIQDAVAPTEAQLALATSMDLGLAARLTDGGM